jgi:hypothetical protein
LNARVILSRFKVPALLVLFSGLAVLSKLPVWLDPANMYGGAADGEQMMWFLSWTPFALTHHENPLLSTYLNYPLGFDLLWNTAMPSLAIVLWPVTALWGAVVTYNVITTAAIALSGFFAYFAIRRYVRSDVFAAVGGLLYGFSPAMIAQQPAHAQVTFSAVTIPLALLLFDELVIRQRMRPWLLGLLIGIFGIFQFFIFEEFFATEVIAAATLAVVLAIFYRQQIAQRLPYATRALAVGAGLVAVVLAYPVLFVQFAGPTRIHGLIHSPEIFSTNLPNFVIPDGNEVLYPSGLSRISATFSGNGSEADGYIGIPLVVIALVVLIRHWRVPVVRVAGITGIVIAIFSMGPHLKISSRLTDIPLPWYPFSRLPLLGNILPSRMMFFVMLALGVLLAFAMQQVWNWKPNVLLPAAVAAVALAPLFPKLPIFSQPLTMPAYFSTASAAEIPTGSVVYTMPFPTTEAMDPLNWQRASGMRFKLLGGYILGPVAPGQDALKGVSATFTSATTDPTISDSLRSTFTQELSDNHVNVVIVGQIANQPAAVAFCTSVLGSPPAVRDGLDIWVLH